MAGTTLVDIGRPIWALAFLPGAELLIGGDDTAVHVWRASDGKEVVAWAALDVRSIAVSRNGRRIAAGTELGRILVWDARTYETVFSHKQSASSVRAVDFSPDSTRLVTGSSNCTASIWDVTTHSRFLGPLHHPDGVTAAKYSTKGDRIATACAVSGSVRIHDSRSGQLLIDIIINVVVYCNTGLTWSNDDQRLFVVSDEKIKQLKASSGSLVEEWPVHEYSNYAYIALSRRGRFLACASNRTVNIWDASTGAQLCREIQHQEDIHSIALSPDDRAIATSSGDGKITISSLQDNIPPSYFSGPFMHDSGAVSDLRDTSDGSSLSDVFHLKQSLAQRESASLSFTSPTSRTDTWSQVLQFITSLARPFGSFFFWVPPQDVIEYRRDVKDSKVSVQTRGDASSGDLMPRVRESDMP